MSLLDSFDEFQSFVNADDDQVAEARRRRRIFEAALLSEPDVLEVVPSGSLARGTHKDPIHDVDLIVVFDESDHADWGQPGGSADEALEHLRDRVHVLLGATDGEVDRVVRLASSRDHAVKCFLDDPDDPDAFTVDAMPALRRTRGFDVPESRSQDWIQTDPERLIRDVAAKHAQWNKYAGMVRMLKHWAAEQAGLKVKSLVMEVLALDHLPSVRSNRPTALAAFFTSAAYRIESGLRVVDPAGLCGEVQPDLDYVAFGERLRDAANASSSAISAQASGDEARASRYWAAIFGDGFPVMALPGGAPDDDRPRPVRDSPQG
jgi:predicted nucleotidyltransferase